MEMTHIYYVYEYKGNDEHDIKPYKSCKIISVEKSRLTNGMITQSVYVDMMQKAREMIADDNNIEYSELSYQDIIITFWSEICHG